MSLIGFFSLVPSCISFRNFTANMIFIKIFFIGTFNFINFSLQVCNSRFNSFYFGSKTFFIPFKGILNSWLRNARNWILPSCWNWRWILNNYWWSSLSIWGWNLCRSPRRERERESDVASKFSGSEFLFWL